MGQIIMTVEAINWTEGDIGYISVCLNGGSCRIDWGDGHISKCRASVHIRVDSGEMDVVDIDISRCQSLVYFEASYLIDYFNLTTNPGIRKVNLRGYAYELADFSNSTELKELYFNNNTGGERHKIGKMLDLTKCDKLEYLECCHAFELTHIAISNRSALKKLVFDENTPLSDKIIEIIKRIVERNGGEIVKINDNDEYIRI